MLPESLVSNRCRAKHCARTGDDTRHCLGEWIDSTYNFVNDFTYEINLPLLSCLVLPILRRCEFLARDFVCRILDTPSDLFIKVDAFKLTIREHLSEMAHSRGDCVVWKNVLVITVREDRPELVVCILRQACP